MDMRQWGGDTRVLDGQGDAGKVEEREQEYREMTKNDGAGI